MAHPLGHVPHGQGRWRVGPLGRWALVRAHVLRCPSFLSRKDLVLLQLGFTNSLYINYSVTLTESCLNKNPSQTGSHVAHRHP